MRLAPRTSGCRYVSGVSRPPWGRGSPDCLASRAPLMVIPAGAGPRGDATVSSFVRSLSSRESRNGRVIDRSAIMRSQSESTGPLVSLRRQCRAIASSRRVKYGIGSHKKEEKGKGEKGERCGLRALRQARMINRSKIPSLFLASNVTASLHRQMLY